MRERFMSSMLAPVVTACTCCPQVPSIKSSGVKPSESDAVAFCGELLREPTVGHETGEDPNIFAKSVEFKIDGTLVGVGCTYEKKDEQTRLIQIVAAVIEGVRGVKAELIDQATLLEEAHPMDVSVKASGKTEWTTHRLRGDTFRNWAPDGCIDKAEVDIGKPSRLKFDKFDSFECPPYARRLSLGDTRQIEWRAAQRQFTEITSAARTLLRHGGLLPRRRK